MSREPYRYFNVTGAGSREPGGSYEPGAVALLQCNGSREAPMSREPGAESREPGAESREPRAESLGCA